MGGFTEQPATNAPVKKRHWVLWLLMFLIVLPAAALCIYTWAVLRFPYSTGQRSGYIQKISKKGWVCKTWEGELAMATVQGTAPQLFEFSVRNDATAQEIEQAAGQRVALDYEQHKGLPTSCFGETEYFVTGVRTIAQ